MPRVELREPWLVACWPGMGAVALVAGHHLARTTNAEAIGEIAAEPWFDVERLAVRRGVLQPVQRPRSVLYALRSPDPKGRDLLILLADAQPTRGWAFCEALLEAVKSYGVKRVVTFAAMASPIEPSAPARVHAVASSERVLAELPKEDVVRMDDGEVAGLNGVLLGAASARGLDGFCLLGEFPYFASALPNPKASAAVLRVFSKVTGIAVDVRALDAQAAEMERKLITLLEQLRKAAAARAPEEGEEEEPEFASPDIPEPEPKEERLSREQRTRIERLFRKAGENRENALMLKSELDRMGVFKEYEDRFLDLFKRGG